MSKSVITDSLLTAIADAIRAKTGGSGQMTPAEMAQEIADIPQGANKPYVEYNLLCTKVHGYSGVEMPKYLLYHCHTRDIDFSGCPGLTVLTDYSMGYTGPDTGDYNLVIPASVLEIGRSCFEGSRLHPSLPSGLTYLDVAAFKNSGFVGTSLPSGLTSIQSDCFSGCKMTAMTVHGGITSIGDNAFYNCTSLASLSIQSGVASIGASAFRKCTALTSVTLPSTVTSLGSNGFAECSHLASIDLGGITSMEQQVLSACNALTSLVIPASVTNIKLYAIYMCTGLASLDVCGAASIAKTAFFKLTGLRTVKFRASGCTIDSAAFNSCAALTDIYVPWSLGDVAGAPWGATNATIHYDTQYDANGNVIS